MAKVKCPKCYHINESGASQCALCKTPLPRIRIEAQAGRHAGASPNVSQFQRGQVLANRYTFLGMIGRGGMGCIYKVRDNALGEEVALKTLLPQFSQEKVVLERFFNEARIARKLSHPNVVRVHDIGMAQNVVYISMEYLSGRSLRSLIEGLPEGDRLPITETLRIVDQLCAALEYAHKYTIHRDIKPENVMITEDGAVKLMDFGISKLMANVQLTGASMVMGTPMYMPPEQVRNSRDVDARADIYSVGVLLYETLTGTPPTGVPKRVTELVPEVPPELEAIVEKCVEPDREKRFASATELRQALQSVRRRIEEGGTRGPVPKAARRSSALDLKKWAGVLLTVLILAAALAGLTASEKRRNILLNQPAPPVETPIAAPVTLHETFDDVQAFVTRFAPQAQTRAEGHPSLLPVLAWANAQWGQAQQTGQVQQAIEALQGYAALLLWPEEDMLFVPPGTVDMGGRSVYVPAFFIDRHEVSYADYMAFCNAAPWRPGAATSAAGGNPGFDPVTNVAYYDAQACAAYWERLLPTEAQWARAAYGETEPFNPASANEGEGETDSTPLPVAPCENATWCGCCDMDYGVSEWTRTPVNNLAGDAPGFGDEMVVRGGNAHCALSDPLQDRANDCMDAPPSIEFQDACLGFRCVLELPESARAIAARINP